MICLKRYFFLFLFVLLGSFFISLFLNVNDSFALDDLVFDSPGYYSNPCPGCYSAGYRYFYVTWEPSSSWNLTSPFRLGFSIFGQQSSADFPSSNSSLYILSILPDMSIYTVSINSNFPSTVVRFTDHLPGDCPSPPSGSLSISDNGTYDVSSYAEAVVDVPSEVIQGDYHDDLTSINHSILICGAVLLVLYFFYCIYRMIIKSTGGK